MQNLHHNAVKEISRKMELLVTKWYPINILYNTMQNIVYYYLLLCFLSLESDKERKEDIVSIIHHL